MKYFKRLAVAAFATAAFNLGASSLLQAQDAPPGDAGNGKRLYLDIHDQPAALIPISGETKNSRRAGCHELRPL